MARIFENGKEILNDVSQKEFDEKVNVNAPIYRYITDNQTWDDILGQGMASKNVLMSIRDDSKRGNTWGSNSAGIAFGGNDTKALIDVEWGGLGHMARVTAGNSKKINWHEDIAWKSDVQRLEQRISALEKQIGGVLSSLLNHLYCPRKVVA